MLSMHKHFLVHDQHAESIFIAHSACIKNFFLRTLSLRKKYKMANISLSLQNKQKKF
jgi:hypothetical protein